MSGKTYRSYQSPKKQEENRITKSEFSQYGITQAETIKQNVYVKRMEGKLFTYAKQIPTVSFIHYYVY